MIKKAEIMYEADQTALALEAGQNIDDINKTIQVCNRNKASLIIYVS